jgi:ubiquinone/menaquinone biosynthesis C-methylase UbiE
MTELGKVFGHPGVAAAYAHRPPYPSDVFDILTDLIVDEPRTVLDIGAGEGALARPLAPRVDRVDALDISAAMVKVGRQRPGGDHPNLRWLIDPVETAELEGPYAAVTAGASLHWMQWEVTLSKLAEVMTPRAQLVIVEHGPRNLPWWDAVLDVIRRHSRRRGNDPTFRLVASLQEQGLFQLTGTAESSPVIFQQRVEDYVEQFHSTASLAREHMSNAESADFDQAVEAIVRPWSHDGLLDLEIVAELSWGRPLHRPE